MINKKLLSIITINKNNACYLEKTIKSIINQSLKIFDLIIIDGKSSDKSVNIIRKYSNKISYWSSSHDINIADASHPFFPFFLFVKKLSFSGDIAAITLRRNIFSHG